MVPDSVARWQVVCEHRGVDYRWDYDFNVRAGLEKTLAARTLLGFLWAWRDPVQVLKNGEVTEYVADSAQGVVVNQKKNKARVQASLCARHVMKIRCSRCKPIFECIC